MRFQCQILLSGVESGSVLTTSGFSAWARCGRESATGSRWCGWHGGRVTGAAAAFELLPLLDRLPVGWLGHAEPQLGCAPGRVLAPGWADEEVLTHGR
jgi:hypothetical protein